MTSKQPTRAARTAGRIGQRRTVVIPKHLFEELKFEAGGFAAFAVRGGGILITPKRLVEPK